MCLLRKGEVDGMLQKELNHIACTFFYFSYCLYLYPKVASSHCRKSVATFGNIQYMKRDLSNRSHCHFKIRFLYCFSQELQANKQLKVNQGLFDLDLQINNMLDH